MNLVICKHEFKFNGRSYCRFTLTRIEKTFSLQVRKINIFDHLLYSVALEELGPADQEDVVVRAFRQLRNEYGKAFQKAFPNAKLFDDDPKPNSMVQTRMRANKKAVARHGGDPTKFVQRRL